ncbi:MAG: hypothetical protein KF774_09100 [Planctomyces sp.]|nr:hypothetical protein [Planctomyces sp.]
MSHTPGPWEIDSNSGIGYLISHDPAPHDPPGRGADTIFPVIVCEVWDEGLGDECTIANARLIAAAPMLLRACRLALEVPGIERTMAGILLEDALRAAEVPRRKHSPEAGGAAAPDRAFRLEGP